MKKKHNPVEFLEIMKKATRIIKKRRLSDTSCSLTMLGCLTIFIMDISLLIYNKEERLLERDYTIDKLRRRVNKLANDDYVISLDISWPGCPGIATDYK